MDKRYRGTFINSLTGFKSVALVGSQDSSGLTNLAIFNSIVHLGAHPPLIGMIVRPDSVDRHTLQNIEETGVYTINHIQESMIQQAHQTSARYPKEVSEFDAVGLTPEYLTNFQAPFVKESNLKMAVQFKEKVSFTSNGTIFVIGEIQQVYLPETAIQSDGLVDLVQVGSITNVGLDSYHTVNRGVRLPYAKP
jgi:flavin reductase (DIM6/NTAB) family NADH-FMN oxidoreductase RutF